MQDVGVEVNAIRPGDRVSNRIDRDSSTDLIIVDRCELARQCVGEVEFAHEAIGERDAQQTRAETLDGCDAGENGHEDSYWSGSIPDRAVGSWANSQFARSSSW